MVKVEQALENRPAKDEGLFVERSCTYQKRKQPSCIQWVWWNCWQHYCRYKFKYCCWRQYQDHNHMVCKPIKRFISIFLSVKESWRKFHWISIIGYGHTNNIFYAVARCLDCGNKLKLLQTKKLCMYFEMALVCLNTSKKKKKFRSFDLNWILGRSMDKNKLRYMEYYGDGDAKAFSASGLIDKLQNY